MTTAVDHFLLNENDLEEDVLARDHHQITMKTARSVIVEARYMVNMMAVTPVEVATETLAGGGVAVAATLMVMAVEVEVRVDLAAIEALVLDLYGQTGGVTPQLDRIIQNSSTGIIH